MLDAFSLLRDRLADALAKPETAAFSPGLTNSIRFGVGPKQLFIIFEQNGPALRDASSEDIAISISASPESWQIALKDFPPPTFQSFSAIQLRNPRFEVKGDPLKIAQARAFLEAVFANLQPNKKPVSSIDLRRLEGRYHRVTTANGQTADIFAETAGSGRPVLCLHTAGADTRQFHGVMCDDQLGRDWRLIGFDMPHHGRSLPPEGWDGDVYRLTQANYLDWAVSFIEQVIREPVTLIGCSMGAGIALALAAERPDLVRAVAALEAPLRPRGRRNPYLTHAAVNGGWHSAAYVRGLMSPQSPTEDRRRAAFIYAQGAPGIYDGDLMFYSDEFDGEVVAKRIDGRRIPVALFIGHYDFSATVDDARALSGWIENAKVIEMPELGHFPMTENPAALLEYLRPVLSEWLSAD